VEIRVSGLTSWLYDERGNILCETRVIQAKAYTTACTYDTGDNLTQMTYPSGRIVSFSRNALGQISGITTKKDAASAAANVATGITWSAMSDLVKASPMATASPSPPLTISTTAWRRCA
jgi:YD repeat-containing protein